MSESNTKPKSLFTRLGPTGLLGLLWTAAPAICGILLLAHIGELSDLLRAQGEGGVLIYSLAFIISAGLGLLPTYSQSILGGWVFGFALGFPAALLGFVGGSLIGYVIAKTVSRHRVQDLIEENAKARAMRNALIGHGFWRTLGLIILIRVPPNSPFALTNLVLASCGVKPLPYVVGTAIGMVPRTAIAVAMAAAAGARAADIGAFIKEGPGPYVLVGGLLATFVMLGVIGAIANKALARATRGKEAVVAAPAGSAAVATSGSGCTPGSGSTGPCEPPPNP
ncbi:MAG: TVP38/TMEM64 family protein [Phycisphaerales bacterium]|nr:TVP38/TMEM64 family protein [Phycisphaerales bacterium]